MKKTFLVLCVGLVVFISTSVFAAPGLINYQGRLTDDSGTPITSSVDIIFTFWDAETDGTQLGSGFSDTDSVTPNSDGLYSTLVGDDPGNLVPSAIFSGDDVWLNVNVGGEDLVPRKRIVTVGYAMAVDVPNFFASWLALPDGDGDGYDDIPSGGTDCDDMDPTVYPGNGC